MDKKPEATGKNIEIQLDLSPELAKRLTAAAREKGVSEEEYVLQAIKDHLKETITFLDSVEQKLNETTDEYLKRAVITAGEMQKTIVISLGNGYVDVRPDTTVEYLRGYLDGNRSGQNFMGFN